MTVRDVLPAATRAAVRPRCTAPAAGFGARLRPRRTVPAAGFGARLTVPPLPEPARIGRVSPSPVPTRPSFAPFAAAVPGALLIVLTLTDRAPRGRT